MAKSVLKKKKTNRRLKKSVRRTLGALCMMTAIIVAAIPFPDAAADDGSAASGGTGSDPIGYPYSYSDDVNEEDYLTITDSMNEGADIIDTSVNYYKYTYDEDGNVTSTPNGEYYDKSHTAYTIYQNSSGVWQMDWQFEYYANSNNEDGLITKYNGQYAREVVNLEYQVYADYIYLTEKDYNAFLSKDTDESGIIPEENIVNAYCKMDANIESPDADDCKVRDKKVKTLYHQYIMEGDPNDAVKYPSGNSTTEFYTVHFNKEYSQYITDYQAYITYTNKTEEEKKEIPEVFAPQPLVKTYADVYKTDQERTQFFCDQVFGGGTPMELVGVRLRTASEAEEDTVYVPRLLNNPTSKPAQINGLLYWVDNNLFLADKTNSIAGIAKNAFKGVTNVTTLTMAKEIDFVGDCAFEGSFVQDVTFVKGAKIGNGAFKNCQDLVNVDMTAGVREIGAEAFSGTALTNVVLPNTIEVVGAGAFYNCKSLQDVTFNDTANTVIKEYVFFDCPALNNVNFGKSTITEIGKCAFALDMVPTGNMRTFNFPNSIASGTSIGEYFFGGRTNLVDVVMPTNLGTAAPSKLKSNIFYNCSGLGSVTFPETCYNIGYERTADEKTSTIFNDVKNPNFYVRGPKTDGAGGVAAARKDTWVCKFGDAADDSVKNVPYVYNENGQDYYEICDELGYLSVIDGTGTLVSSQFMPGATKQDIGNAIQNADGTWTVEKPYEIPATVGNTKVTGIADGCFTGKDGILNNIVALKIEDGSDITEIGDNVFKGAPKLKHVYIGDSVTSIGNDSFAECGELGRVEIGKSITSIGSGAFENCPKLEYMKFAIPDAITDMTIGENAFSTSGDKLTIEGVVDANYGPFKWAMEPSCFMDPVKGVRVLYKSPSPQTMSVILDNKNNMPTLVDYPRIDSLPNEPEYDKDGNKIKDGLRDRYEEFGDAGEYTTGERALIDACLNVKIPSGIKSIDAQAYFNNSSEPKDGVTVNNGLNNEYSIQAYFYDGNSLGDIYEAYKGDVDKRGGLFSCNYGTIGEGEYITGDPNELVEDGNDRIQTIQMEDVEYLPDNCFYSCENLQNVLWSNDMQDVGSVPFELCTKLLTANGSDAYTCENGILYKNNADGSKTLVECFASRGTDEGPGVSTISFKNDPLLTNVTEIEPGAFRNCKEIISADFVNGGTVKFTSIPEECFKGAELLAYAYLPANVNYIGREAFADTGKSTDVWVYSDRAVLGEKVFGSGDEKVSKPKITAYEDSGIRQQAREQGIDVSETIPTDGSLTVTFFVRVDDKLTEVAKVTGVQPGDSVRKDAPDEVDLADYIPEGYELTGWEGTEDINNITTNCFFIATITYKDSIDTDGDGIPDTPKPDDGNNGNTGNNGNNGNSGNNGNNGNGGSGDGGNGGNSGNGGSGDSSSPSKYTLTVVYGDGSGVYAAGTKVIISAIEPPAGKEFYKWTTTNTGVTITSATSAATTVKTTNSDAVVTATYRDKSSVSSNAVNRKPIGSSGSTVQITKPGISNTDKAYASVSGSTDNFIIKITESTEAANAVATALSNKYYDMNPIKYFAMDISLYDKNGNKVTNTNGLSVNVTMPIPDALVQYGGNNKVGAVVNGNVLEDLNCKFTTVDGIPCVTFTATHFSPYTIYVDTSNLSVNTLDSTPKTGDGIHPKWFVSIALACISLILFMKRDKVVAPRKITV